MKSQIIIKSLIVAALTAFISHFVAADETFHIFNVRIVSINAEQVTVSIMEGPRKNEEKTFALRKNVVLRNVDSIAEIEEGMKAYLRVDEPEEVCLVINVQK